MYSNGQKTACRYSQKAILLEAPARMGLAKSIFRFPARAWLSCRVISSLETRTVSLPFLKPKRTTYWPAHRRTWKKKRESGKAIARQAQIRKGSTQSYALKVYRDRKSTR